MKTTVITTSYPEYRQRAAVNAPDGLYIVDIWTSKESGYIPYEVITRALVDAFGHWAGQADTERGRLGIAKDAEEAIASGARVRVW